MSEKKEKKVGADLETSQKEMAEQYGATLINLNVLKKNLKLMLGLPQYSFCVVGFSGVGKTELVKQLANEEKIGCVTLMLSQLSEGDLQGLPYPDRETKTTVRYPLHLIPTEEAVARGEYPKKGILFLDELNRATREVQNAAFQLIGERRCGDSKLADGWIVGAAINPEGGEYLVNKMDPAMLNRMCIYAARVDASAWLDWAEAAGINSCIRDFIASGHSYLYNLQDLMDNKAFASPRSWERFSRTLDLLISNYVNEKIASKEMDPDNIEVSYKEISSILMDHTSLASGYLGATYASVFLGFMADYTLMYPPKDIFDHYSDSDKDKFKSETWYGMRNKIKNAAATGQLAMINNTNEQLLSHIRSTWPAIFNNKKTKTKATMTSQFLNFEEYWEDISHNSLDKSVALYQGILEPVSDDDIKEKKAQLNWCIDLQEAFRIMREEKGEGHFMTGLLAANQIGLSQQAAYAGKGSKS